jgi:hypothetical protein
MPDVDGRWWYVWDADGETVTETRNPREAAHVVRTNPRAATVEDRHSGLEWRWDGALHGVDHSEPPPPELTAAFGSEQPASSPPTDGPLPPAA